MAARSRIVYLGDVTEIPLWIASRAELLLIAWIYEKGDDVGVIHAAAKAAGVRPLEAASVADVRNYLKAAEPVDAGVVSNFGIILPEDCLQTAGRGFFNLHLGLLPEFAGRRPVEKAVKSGADFTGVTLHRMTEKVDSGPIIDRRRVAVGEANEADLMDRLKRLASRVLADHLVLLAG